MNLVGRKALIAVVATLVAVAGIGAALIGRRDLALAVLTLLVLVAIALQLQALRRIDLRQRSLDRLEQKLDVVSRRVVTESEATGRELGGRIDELAAELRRPT